MKQQAIQYLAFDVHQATSVACVRDEAGHIRIEATLRTEGSAILEFVKGLGRRVHVAFEEGTQAQWLHDLLLPHVQHLIVCNIRGEKKSGNKSDRIDARLLSERLRTGSLRAVYHGSSRLLNLKELVRSYINLVEDATRVMQRIKALFRGRAIGTPGRAVYRASERNDWLAKLDGGSRTRAAALLAHLDVLLELRPAAKAAMLAEARRQPAWRILRSIPQLGPIRVAEILAILRTPYRFRTKRNLWAYAGFAVVTWSSADQIFADGQLRRRKRAPLTRGLNRNHNPILKDIFKAAATAATSQPGPLREFYQASLARGVDPDLAKVTLARKIASVTLRLWKKGELWNPDKLTMQAT